VDQKKQVGFELRLLMNASMREIQKNEYPFDEDNHSPRHHSPMHGRVVDYLIAHQNEDIYQKDIENAFEIRRSTASKILKSMETHHLIQRIPVEHDARLKKIVLTKKAIKFLEKIQNNMQQFENKITKNITKEELDVFFTTIDKMKKNLE